MKRKSKRWQSKMDDFCLKYLEVYSEARRAMSQAAEPQDLGSYVQTANPAEDVFQKNPELRQTKTIRLAPEFVQMLEASPHLRVMVQEGDHVYPARIADTLEMMQTLLSFPTLPPEVKLNGCFMLSLWIVIGKRMLFGFFTALGRKKMVLGHIPTQSGLGRASVPYSHGPSTCSRLGVGSTHALLLKRLRFRFRHPKVRIRRAGWFETVEVGEELQILNDAIVVPFLDLGRKDIVLSFGVLGEIEHHAVSGRIIGAVHPSAVPSENAIDGNRIRCQK
jgi:hypothetical protein